MDENQPKKRTTVRLKSVRSQMQTVINQLDDIINSTSEELKRGKREDAVFQKAALLSTIYTVDSDERRLRIKHASEDALLKENSELKALVEQLRAELRSRVPTPAGESFEDKLKRHGIEGGSCTQA